MKLTLGEKIKQLRIRDGRKQEELANALGVTNQAVSRWEKDGSYPDMELIPAIANYFGVSIDELFGYENDREKKIDQLVSQIYELDKQNNGVDMCVDRCIALARDGLTEFPGNEKVMLCLATTLYNAGYVRYGEHHLTGEDGYDVHDVERHRTYSEWQEAIKLYEKLLPSLDHSIRYRATTDLCQLYLNNGYYEKSVALSETAPTFNGCRELLRFKGCDGIERAKVLGEDLLLWAETTADLMVSGVSIGKSHITAEKAVQTLQNAVKIYDLVCSDGNYGLYSGHICRIYLYMSYYLWLAGRYDDAFLALDSALKHAKETEKYSNDRQSMYTAPILRQVKVNPEGKIFKMASELPEVWPWWAVPDYGRIMAEIEADPRWAEWVAKTKESDN